MRKILLSLSLCLLACDEGDDKKPIPSPTEDLSTSGGSTGGTSDDTTGPVAQTDGGSTAASTGGEKPSMCNSASCAKDADCGPNLLCVDLLDYPTKICAEPCLPRTICDTSAKYKCDDSPALACKDVAGVFLCMPTFCATSADCNDYPCIDNLCHY